MSQRSPRSANRPPPVRSPFVGIVIYTVLTIWSLICLFPLYWIFVTSLKGEAEIMRGPYYVPFVDFTPSLDAWVSILTYANDHLLWRFVNSTVVAVAATALTVLTAGLAVYGLTRFHYMVRLMPFPRTAWFTRRMPCLGNDGILFAILATRIVPPVAIVLPIFVMAQHTGLLNSYFALVLTYAAANLPVAIWLLLPVFGNAATAQEEAAYLDGASHFQIFFTIFVPMIAASIAAVGLVIFVLCWNEYLFAVYLAADEFSTMPPWVMGQMSIKEAQVGGDAEEWPQLSAAIVLMVVPLIACASIVQRFLTRIVVSR